MPYRPHRLEPNYPGPEVVASPSPAPPVIVAAWCVGVERMNRRQLDRFTRDIWRRFDQRDLEPLEWAIIRRVPRGGRAGARALGSVSGAEAFVRQRVVDPAALGS